MSEHLYVIFLFTTSQPKLDQLTASVFIQNKLSFRKLDDATYSVFNLSMLFFFVNPGNLNETKIDQ